MEEAREQQEKYTAASAEWQKNLALDGDDLGQPGNSQYSNSNHGIVGT